MNLEKRNRRAVGVDPVGSGGMTNVVLLPVRDELKQRAELDRDVEALIDAFRELREVEKMTGRTGLSARVRVSIMNIMMSADKIAMSRSPKICTKQ